MKRTSGSAEGGSSKQMKEVLSKILSRISLPSVGVKCANDPLEVMLRWCADSLSSPVKNTEAAYTWARTSQDLIVPIRLIWPMLHRLIHSRCSERSKLPPAEHKYEEANRTWSKICPEVQSSSHVRFLRQESTIVAHPPKERMETISI